MFLYHAFTLKLLSCSFAGAKEHIWEPNKKSQKSLLKSKKSAML